MLRTGGVIRLAMMGIDQTRSISVHVAIPDKLLPGCTIYLLVCTEKICMMTLSSQLILSRYLYEHGQGSSSSEVS